jgi:hypothetical protein
MGCLFFAVGLTLLAQLDGKSTVYDAAWRVIFLGAGIGFTMPTMASAAMGSLPPQVAGVGSGALNTLRQVGFSLGLAVVVAIFSGAIVDSVVKSADEATQLVKEQAAVPAAVKEQVTANLAKVAQQAESGQGSPRLTAQDPLAAPGGGSAGGSGSGATSVGAPPPGSPAAEQQDALRDDISAIFRDNIADAFTPGFYAMALAALLAVIPSLFVGRRLGEHTGHEELSRAERAEAAQETAGR